MIKEPAGLASELFKVLVCHMSIMICDSVSHPETPAVHGCRPIWSDQRCIDAAHALGIAICLQDKDNMRAGGRDLCSILD